MGETCGHFEAQQVTERDILGFSYPQAHLNGSSPARAKPTDNGSSQAPVHARVRKVDVADTGRIHVLASQVLSRDDRVHSLRCRAMV